MASQKFQRTHTRERCQSDEEDLDILSHTEVQTAFENALEHHPDGAENSCAYCSKEIGVTNATSLQRGQHISLRSQSTAGSGKPYRHHAIIKEIISRSGNSVKLRLIHFDKQNGKIKIYETIESYDLTIHKLRIIKYIHPRYSPEKIIRRAEQVLNTCGEGKFDSYNPLTCNCEHFATWCVVGKEESFQVQTLRVVIENVLKFVFGGNISLSKFIAKALFVSSDEIASVLTTSTTIPVGILAGSIVAYCIYCIYFTVLLCKQYFKDRTICKQCLIQNLLKLWLKFVVYIGTSSLTFFVQRYVLPLLTPLTGIPLMVLLLAASTALLIIIEKKGKPDCSDRVMSNMHQLSTLAMEIIQAQALNAIFGTGLMKATNWTLRAALKRTTLLLVPKTPETESTVQGDVIKILQEQIAVLSTQLQAIFTTETEAAEMATSHIFEPEPDPSPPPPPPPTKKEKGKKGMIKTSTHTPTHSPGVAMNLDKKLEEATPKEKWESPMKTARMPEKTKEKLMGKLCDELGLTSLLNDKRKAESFISAVTYIGFRSLHTSPPTIQQWHFALKILTRHYYEAFLDRPLHHLFDAAAYIASSHGLYFPRISREEERTAAFLMELEDRRGTFTPYKYQPF